MTMMFKRSGRPTSVLTRAFPWITKIFPKFMDRHKTMTLNRDVLDLMEESIEEHEESLDVNDPRDFTDKVLIEIGRTTDPLSSFHGETGKLNLANTLFDLFMAGSETTSTTLTWAILYMARLVVEVQQKY